MGVRGSIAVACTAICQWPPTQWHPLVPASLPSGSLHPLLASYIAMHRNPPMPSHFTFKEIHPCHDPQWNSKISRYLPQWFDLQTTCTTLHSPQKFWKKIPIRGWAWGHLNLQQHPLQSELTQSNFTQEFFAFLPLIHGAGLITVHKEFESFSANSEETVEEGLIDVWVQEVLR